MMLKSLGICENKNKYTAEIVRSFSEYRSTADRQSPVGNHIS